MLAILDCGTTNTKCYFVDDEGKSLFDCVGKFGVKDNVNNDAKLNYKNKLRELVLKEIERHGGLKDELKTIVFFGMISSDLGLIEIPHLITPVSLQDLQNGVFEHNDRELFGEDVRIYFLRGVKNQVKNELCLQNLESCDFMRGEETQVVGIFEAFRPKEDFCVIMFGSHTKIINISSEGKICQSMTTMSGQIFDVLMNHTIIGKSMEEDVLKRTLCLNEIIDLAESTSERFGFMRAILMPRYMQKFTKISYQERREYLEALIAIEDIKAMSDYFNYGKYSVKKYFLIGTSFHCLVFKEVIRKKYGDVVVELIDKEKNKEISVLGVMKTISKKVNENK